MVSLEVEGMTCMGCVRSVEAALKKADPTAKVAIDLPSGKVDLDGALDFAAAKSVIEASGFDVKP
jgi:copper chaperone